MREQHIAAHEEWREEENEIDGSGGGRERKDRTACKGQTAQFISVKETIWLEFLLLSHSELLNSLYLHVVPVRVCTCVFLYLCLCGSVDKKLDVCLFWCVCVWLFGSLCSRCTGLLLCGAILNGWRRHFFGFSCKQNWIFSSLLLFLLSNRQLQDRICSPGSAELWKAYMNISKLAGSSWSKNDFLSMS